MCIESAIRGVGYSHIGWNNVNVFRHW